MTDQVNVSGSLRSRLTFILIGGAAMLAMLLYGVARLYAAQIAQQGQDSILAASATSILDAAILRDGAVEELFGLLELELVFVELERELRHGDLLGSGPGPDRHGRPGVTAQ